MTLPLIVFAAWTVLWAWMFFDCLRRPTLPPMFGSVRLARIVWLVGLLLFNPLPTLLYVVLVKLRGGDGRGSIARDLITVTGLVVAVWLQFGFGAPSGDGWRAGDEPLAISLSMHTTTTGSSLMTSTGAKAQPFPARHVRVIHGPHPVATIAARRLARELLQLGAVEHVECWPRGRRLDDGARAPDYYIEVDGHGLTSLQLPFVQNVSGAVTLSAGAAPGMSFRGGRDLEGVSMAKLEMRSTLQLNFWRYGVALGGAVWGQPAEPVRSWLSSSVIEPLADAIDAGGLAPDFPGAYGFEPAVVPPQIETRPDLERLESECPRFAHNRTVWRFPELRPATAVLTELQAAFESDGWTRSGWSTWSDDERPVLELRRGSESLSIGRWPPAPEPGMTFEITFPVDDGEPKSRDEPRGSREPFFVRYENWFTPSELRAARDGACVDGAELETWLLFRGSLELAQVATITEELRTARSPRVPHWLWLAELSEQAGDLDGARSAIEVALALTGVTDVDDDVQDKVESLAGRLQVEQPEPSVALLARAGYVPLTLGESHVVDVPIGKLVRLAVLDKDGRVMIGRTRLVGTRDAIRLWMYAGIGGGSVTSTRAARPDIDGRLDFGTVVGYGSCVFAVVATPVTSDRYQLDITVR